MPKVAIDTSVIIEYIDKAAEFHDQANAVFTEILNGELEAIIPHPILSETYYITAKIYQKLGMKNHKRYQQNLWNGSLDFPQLQFPWKTGTWRLKLAQQSERFSLR